MRILYVASQSPHGTGAHRLSAIRRLGHSAVPFGTDTVADRGTRVTKWLRYRTLVGPAIRSFNHRLMDAVSAQHFDLVWFDKPVYVWPRTVQALRRTGALVVSYNPDNPYGPRRDPGWRLFLKSLPEFDIHLVPRQSNVTDYQNSGAARVLVMPFSFEPPLHFPPPDGWTDAERNFEVGFIGSPYDDRADFFRMLWRRHHIVVRVRGSRWERVLTTREKKLLYEGRAAYSDGYREAIWRTRINLGFVTHANRDTNARRWFEITACGALLLAERTDDGLRTFDNGTEAVFFTGVDECARHIRRLLPDVHARESIARAGRVRAVSSGYDNDSRLEEVFKYISTS